MQQLFNLFDEFGLPYYRQGSMSDEDYSAEFFTHWNVDTPNIKFRDNVSKAFSEYVQVGYYTNNLETLYSRMDEFCDRARAKGFIVVGRPQDANADKDDYFGRVVYLRIINETEE